VAIAHPFGARWLGHPSRQPGDEVEWLKEDVRGAVTIRRFQLIAYLTVFVPARLCGPPGDILGIEMELRGITLMELARQTGITQKHIISILKAKSAIPPEIAIKLERALGMPVEYWLNLESHYLEILARETELQQLEKDLDWLKRIPVNAMAKLGWIKELLFRRLLNPKFDRYVSLEIRMEFFDIHILGGVDARAMGSRKAGWLSWTSGPRKKVMCVVPTA
jgi:addiction module HigA family antidote